MQDTKDQILELVKEANPDNPLQYVHNIVADYAKEKLDLCIENCKDCDICKGPVKTTTCGNPNASVLIISDVVSKDVVEMSTEGSFKRTSTDVDVTDPISGESFNSFIKVIESLNVNKDQLFYINSVNCWPTKEINKELISRTPTKQEVDNCKVFVDYAIQLVQPLVIITLGNIALNLYKKEAISKARGNWFYIKGIPALPTYHPGYFDKIEKIKDEEIVDLNKEEFYEDIQKAFEYINETYPKVKIFNE